jgi:hypothetical protein
LITVSAAAVAAAERGLALFPLPPGGRRPDPGWQRRCTASPDAAARMIATGNVGVGCRASRVVGLDLDRHPGEPDGIAAFTAACAGHGGWPATFTVRTPRNGLHVYFRAPDWPIMSGPGPWPGTDIRAPGRRSGGYLVGPGSAVTDGYYVVEHDVPLAPLPGWLALLLVQSARCPAVP